MDMVLMGRCIFRCSEGKEIVVLWPGGRVSIYRYCPKSCGVRRYEKVVRLLLFRPKCNVSRTTKTIFKRLPTRLWARNRSGSIGMLKLLQEQVDFNNMPKRMAEKLWNHTLLSVLYDGQMKSSLSPRNGRAAELHGALGKVFCRYHRIGIWCNARP